MRRRLMNTCAMRGRSSGRPVSFSTIDASDDDLVVVEAERLLQLGAALGVRGAQLARTPGGGGAPAGSGRAPRACAAAACRCRGTGSPPAMLPGSPSSRRERRDRWPSRSARPCRRCRPRRGCRRPRPGSCPAGSSTATSSSAAPFTSVSRICLRRGGRDDLVAAGLEAPGHAALAGVQPEDGRVARSARRRSGSSATSPALAPLGISTLDRPARGAGGLVAVAPGRARHDGQRDRAHDAGDRRRRAARVSSAWSLLGPPRGASGASSQRRRIMAAASRSMTSRRRARDRSAASRTSSASTVLKLSSISSTGTASAARSRSAKASRALGRAPALALGRRAASPSTTRSASYSRTTAAMASRSRWPPRRAMVACGCAVSPSPSVTATPMRRVPRSMAMTLPRHGTRSVYRTPWPTSPKGPAGRTPQPARHPQIQIDIDEATAQGAYSNLVLINHNDNEFVLDFAYIQPAAPRARVRRASSRRRATPSACCARWSTTSAATRSASAASRSRSRCRSRPCRPAA